MARTVCDNVDYHRRLFMWTVYDRQQSPTVIKLNRLWYCLYHKRFILITVGDNSQTVINTNRLWYIIFTDRLWLEPSVIFCVVLIAWRTCLKDVDTDLSSLRCIGGARRPALGSWGRKNITVFLVIWSEVSILNYLTFLVIWSEVSSRGNNHFWHPFVTCVA